MGKRSLKPLFTSHTTHWVTPEGLKADLYREFKLDFDPCPLRSENDGLSIEWVGKRIFCNPPYGPAIGKFLAKYWETEMAVYLLPARTDTKWFHDTVLPHASEIRFVRGRLRFGTGQWNAPFSSMIVIFEA